MYHAFDLLHLDSWDLLDVPLEERKRLLQLVLREHPSVRYVSHVLEHGEDFQRAVIEQGLEGSVAKLRRSRYEPETRSRSWLKIKARREQELVLVGYEPGKGSHRDLGALLVATLRGGGLALSPVRSGAAWMSGHASCCGRSWMSTPCPIRPRRASLRSPRARWCEPRHVIRVEFTEWTPDGLLRQAVYKGRELGRDPRTVSREPVERLWRVQRQLATETEDTDASIEAARAERARRAQPPPRAVPAWSSSSSAASRPNGRQQRPSHGWSWRPSASSVTGDSGRWVGIR